MFLDKCMNLIGIKTSTEEDVEEVEDLDDVENKNDVEENTYRSGFGRRNIERKSYEADNKVMPKVLPMSQSLPAPKMVITQPMIFDDVKEIGEYLKEKKSVIVNLETVNKEDHRRIIDFISGAVYVLDGSVQKISSLIYLITPKQVEIQNDIERAQYRNKLPFTWMK